MFGKLTRLYIALHYCYNHERFFLCISISNKDPENACKVKCNALKARFKNINNLNDPRFDTEQSLSKNRPSVYSGESSSYEQSFYFLSKCILG